MPDRPSPPDDRLQARARAQLRELARPSRDLVATRIPGSRFVYAGLIGSGYARLEPSEARGLAELLGRLADEGEAESGLILPGAQG